MEIIAAVDKNFGIGKDNDLLAHISPDLKRLRAMTVGNIIVMGSRTYLGFPKRPLPDRTNIVITRHPESFAEVRCFSDINEFLGFAKTADRPVFVLGGGSIYEQLLPYCDKAHITKILHSFEADTFFPRLDSMEDWRITSESDILNDGTYSFKYVEYCRI